MPFAKRIADLATEPLKRKLEHEALELKHKVASYGIGAGLIAAAAVLSVFAVGFALATGAAALALVMPTWTALLIVTGLLFAAAGIAGLIGVKKLKR